MDSSVVIKETISVAFPGDKVVSLLAFVSVQLNAAPTPANIMGLKLTI